MLPEYEESFSEVWYTELSPKESVQLVQQYNAEAISKGCDMSNAVTNFIKRNARKRSEVGFFEPIGTKVVSEKKEQPPAGVAAMNAALKALNKDKEVPPGVAAMNAALAKQSSNKRRLSQEPGPSGDASHQQDEFSPIPINSQIESKKPRRNEADSRQHNSFSGRDFGKTSNPTPERPTGQKNQQRAQTSQNWQPNFGENRSDRQNWNQSNDFGNQRQESKFGVQNQFERGQNRGGFGGQNWNESNDFGNQRPGPKFGVQNQFERGQGRGGGFGGQNWDGFQQRKWNQQNSRGQQEFSQGERRHQGYRENVDSGRFDPGFQGGCNQHQGGMGNQDYHHHDGHHYQQHQQSSFRGGGRRQQFPQPRQNNPDGFRGQSNPNFRRGRGRGGGPRGGANRGGPDYSALINYIQHYQNQIND